MSKKVCVFSVIFPANLPYFHAFLDSLARRDTLGRMAFQLYDSTLLDQGLRDWKEVPIPLLDRLPEGRAVVLGGAPEIGALEMVPPPR